MCIIYSRSSSLVKACTLKVVQQQPLVVCTPSTKHIYSDFCRFGAKSEVIPFRISVYIKVLLKYINCHDWYTSWHTINKYKTKMQSWKQIRFQFQNNAEANKAKKTKRRWPIIKLIFSSVQCSCVFHVCLSIPDAVVTTTGSKMDQHQ